MHEYGYTNGITRNQFVNFCPGLLFMLIGLEHADQHYPDGIQQHLNTSESSYHLPKVWGFSCLSVLVISLVELLGVTLIPFMQKVFYNHLLQFLVALAVGALSGDAMLHLIPHKVKIEMHRYNHDNTRTDHSKHMTSVLKGLCGLGGIFFFFLIERLLTIHTQEKGKRNKGKSKHTNNKTVYSKEQNTSFIEHASGHDCDDMIMGIHPGHKGMFGFNYREFHLQFFLATKRGSHTTTGSHAIYHGHKERERERAVHMPFILDTKTERFTQTQRERESERFTCHSSWTQREVHMPFILDTKRESERGSHVIHPGHKEREVFMSFILDKKRFTCHSSWTQRHKGLEYCGVKAVPKTVAAIAWMVIVGDGIHTFSDGLAIGAAFAASLTGGLSTSIAIFCHEIPHEIGDFAVLLRAGMTVKQALVYNCLSSVLAFMGMCVGIFIGNIEGANQWIFVGVAGIFLYIALVDMLPQVSDVDTKKGEHPLCHLLLQISGMMLGGGIMFLIAIFEHDLKNLF
ncbi:solute carrier family 39 (zinc transporter), member 10 [Mytilus galloprovincialis]|uniref:Solute carrier family 39 (Zinc transporter), member 10 n=1 Tax=Mytilus galloprovincialis TaxID=29158 RepID=A0A8B6DDD4_MYTGA|nr:solute carrier family 39 (zinc transporter), member 10 [Mytilus galloprovincialis]